MRHLDLYPFFGWRNTSSSEMRSWTSWGLIWTEKMINRPIIKRITKKMIRAITEKDADAFIRIRRDSLRLEPRSFGADPDAEIDREATFRNLQAKNEEDFVLGYFDEGKLIGLLGFIRESKRKKRHKGRIWGFFVYPEYRGKGIGRALFQECLDRASAIEGLEKVILSVTAVSERALAFYQSFGFKEYGREKGSMKWEGEWLEEIFMEKRL